MNRHTLPLLVLCAAGPLAAQDGPRKMTIAPEVGATGTYRSTVVQTQKMAMLGQDLRSEIVTELQVRVDEVTQDGTVKATATWHRIRGTMESAMQGTASFDTRDPDAAFGSLGDMAEALAGITGQATQLTFGPNGKLLDRKPLDALVSKVHASLEGPMKLQVQQVVAVRSLEEQASVFGRFPDEPIAPGSEWSEKLEVGDRVLPLVRESNYKLTAADDDQVVVQCSGKVVVGKPKEDAGNDEEDDDPQVQMARAMMRDARISDGVIDGETTLSRKDGLLAASSMRVKMKLEMPNPMGGDDPFVVDVEQTSKLERVTGEAQAPGKDADDKSDDKARGEPAKKK